jgi:uncharacterized protein (TIGR02145 family)
MNNPILRLLAISWHLRRHFIALCATQLITNYFALNTSAQAPQGIPYQAIARNASGVAIANTAVKVRFSIRDSIATGAIKYQETHNPTTSALGLFSVNVGMGTVVSGTFSGINWGKNAKFLQVELNTTGGTTYTDLGTTQMMSVPYALQANGIKMKTSASGDTLYTGGGNYLIIPGISSANPIMNQPEAPVTDIDGNVYQTVRIGTQVWMKENLKVSKYRNGNSIQSGLTDNQWNNVVSGAYAMYDNDPSNNSLHGNLYNWYAVADPRGLCPIGWRIADDTDYSILENGLGGNQACSRLKAISILWSNLNQQSSNLSGFSLLPSGYRSSTGQYNAMGWESFLWSLSDYSSENAWARYVNYACDVQSTRMGTDKHYGFSVRCIKN